MRKRRNWFKTTIAMLTLVATVIETGFTSVSTLAAEFTNEDGIVVNNDAVEEAAVESDNTENNEDLKIEVVPDESKPEEGEIVENDNNNGSSEEFADPQPSEAPAEDNDASAETLEGSNPSEEALEDGAVKEETQPIEKEEIFEEAEELKEGKLELSDNGIFGSGYNEISVYVDTEKLAKKDTFRIEFSGPESASYNGVINDELDKTNDGRYDFENLEGGDFRISASSSVNVILSYKYNEDGYPTIYVESKPVDKKLENASISGRDSSAVEGIIGEGYESVKIEFDTENLTDKAAFKLFVDTDADAKVDGRSVSGGIDGLSKDTQSVTIEDLENEQFTAYVVSDNDLKISTEVKITNVDDGEAAFTVSVVNTKRVYDYEDNDVRVTATLEKVDAIPDDAYFSVTPLKADETGKYLDALNDKKEEDAPVYTNENTLFYDVAFYTDETMTEEIEPEEGSVTVSIEFKKKQLEEEVAAVDDENIEINHFDESGNDIVPETVEADVSVEGEKLEVSLDSFSVISVTSVTQVEPGTSRTVADILGDAIYYGVTANEIDLKGHIDANMATGLLKANKNTTQGQYTGSHNPGDDIIADFKGTKWFADSAQSIPFTIRTTKEVEKVLMEIGEFKTRTVGQPNGYVTVDSNNIKSDLEKEVKALVGGTKSEALKNEKDNGKVYEFEGAAYKNGPWYLDISNRPAGTYYFTFTKHPYSYYQNDGGDIHFKLRKDQMIVLNVPGKKVSLTQFQICLVGESDDYKSSAMQDASADEYCQHIVWNMYEADEVGAEYAEGEYYREDGNKSILGIVLVPNGTFNIGGTATGWLVANKVTNGGEWHGVWQEMPPSGLHLTLRARKTVSNNKPDENAGQVFTFDLYEGQKDGNTVKTVGDAIDSKQNSDGGCVTFKTLDYEPETGAGEYWYVVKERATDSDEFEYDKTEYAVNVKIEKSGKSLKFAWIKVFKNGALNTPLEGTVSACDNTPIVFDNTPKIPVVDPTEITLYAKKTISGKNPGNKKFWFTLYDSNSEGVIDNFDNYRDRVQNDGSKIEFNTIEYPADTIQESDNGKKTFYYAIKEEPTGNDSKFNSDDTVYVVKVVVEKQGNSLVVTEKHVYKRSSTTDLNVGQKDVTNENKTPVTFNNTPVTQPTDDTTSFRISVKKTLKDKNTNETITEWPEGMVFKFGAERFAGNSGEGCDDDLNLYKPGKSEVTISSYEQNVSDDPAMVENRSFGVINFTASDIYKRLELPGFAGWTKVFDGSREDPTDWDGTDKYLVGGTPLTDMLKPVEIKTGTIRTIQYKYRIWEKIDSLPDNVIPGADGETLNSRDNAQYYERYLKFIVNVLRYKEEGSKDWSYRFVTNSVIGNNGLESNETGRNNDWKLIVKYSIVNGACGKYREKAFEFTNRYDKPNPDPEVTPIYGLKNYNGPDADLKDFSFTLTSEAKGDAVQDPHLSDRVDNTSVHLEADRTFKFGKNNVIDNVNKYGLKYSFDDIPKGSDSVTFHYVITEDNVEVKNEGTDNEYYVLKGKEHIKVLNRTIEFDVKVSLPKDGSNKLVVENQKATPSTTPDFNNEYSADGELTFNVTKEFKNLSNIKTPNKTKFTFWLEGGKVGESPNIKQKTEIEMTAGSTPGNASFTPSIKFADVNAKGTYKYTIYEEHPGDADLVKDETTNTWYYEKDGYRYDARGYHITVKVDDNGSGQLVPVDVTAGYDDGSDQNTATETKVTDLNAVTWRTAAFNNTYDFVPVKGYIDGEKKLSGGKKAVTTEKFTFVLKQANPDRTDGTYSAADVVMPANLSVTNGTDPNRPSYFKFDDITFNAAGEYWFEVYENSAAGVQGVDSDEAAKYGFDGNHLKVKFVVTPKSGGRGLDIKKYDPEGGVKFTNPYLEGSVPIYVKKKFYAPNGVSAALNHVFLFRLENTDGNDKKNFPEVSGNQSVYETTNPGSDNWNNAFLIGPADGLHYDLSMVDKDANGNYIATEYKYKVSEVIDQDIIDELEKNQIYKGFKYGLDINTYGGDTLSEELKASIISGAAQSLQTVEHEITIKLEAVKDENGDYSLVITPDKFTRENPQDTAVKFLNTYVPTETDFNIIGEKVLEGRDEGFIAGEYGDKFTIQLTYPDGTTVEKPVTFTAGDRIGNFSFPMIHVNREIVKNWTPYDNNNNYLFTVTELPGGWAQTANGQEGGRKIAAGTNDPHATYYVLVHIEEKDGAFSVSKTIYPDADLDPAKGKTETAEGDPSVPIISYTNTYTKPGHASVKATKYYNGNMEDEKFTFFLKDKGTKITGNNNILTAGVDTEHGDAINFNEIEYSFDGKATAATADNKTVNFQQAAADWTTVAEGGEQVFYYRIVEQIDPSKKYTVKTENGVTTVSGYIKYPEPVGEEYYETESKKEYVDVYEVEVHVKKSKDTNGAPILVTDRVLYKDLVSGETGKTTADITNELKLSESIAIPVTKVFESKNESMTPQTFTFRLTEGRPESITDSSRHAERTVTIGGSAKGAKDQAIFDPEVAGIADLEMLKFTEADINPQTPGTSVKDGKFIKYFTLKEEFDKTGATPIDYLIEAEDNGKTVYKKISAYLKDGVIYDDTTYIVEVHLWLDPANPDKIQTEWKAEPADSAKNMEMDYEKYDGFFSSLFHKIKLSVLGLFGVANPNQNIVFFNSYKAEGKLQLGVKKVMNGRELTADDNGKFKFTLSGKCEGVSIDETVGIDDDGYAYFPAMKLTKPTEDGKDYTFKIKEEKDTQPGVKNNTDEYTVSVKVTDDGKGSLKVQYKVNDADYKDASEEVIKVTDEAQDGKYVTTVPNESDKAFVPGVIEIVNDYIPDPADIKISGWKDFFGSSDKEYWFAFTLTGSKVAEGGETVYVNKGKVDFASELKFTATDLLKADGKTYEPYKDFVYTVKESKDVYKDKNGKEKYSEEEIKGKIVFDEYDVREITVRVEDEIGTDGKRTGKLNAYIVSDGVTKYKSGDETNKIADDKADVANGKLFGFSNAYGEGELKLPVDKIVKGTPVKNYKDKEFVFELLGADGKRIGDRIVLKDKNEDGTFKSGEFNVAYKLEQLKEANGVYSGEFDYKVREVSHENDSTYVNYPGYTYDLTEYDVHVVVRSGDDQKLHVYKTIVPVDKDGNPKGDALCKEAEGTVSLPFTNEYAAEGSATINGLKILLGGEISKHQFTFEIEDEKGNKKEATTDANGIFTFGTEQDGLFRFTTEDLKVNGVISDKPITRVYKVREKDHGKTVKGIAHSDAEYTVTVTVEDKGEVVDGKAKLSVVPVIEKSKKDDFGYITDKEVLDRIEVLRKRERVEAPAHDKDFEFENVYYAKGETDPPIITKKVMGEIITAGQFQFMLTDDKGNEITLLNEKTGKLERAKSHIRENDASGAIEFGNIHYTYEDLDLAKEAGNCKDNKYYTFDYTVVEVKDKIETAFSESEGLKAVFTFRRTVYDDGEGNIVELDRNLPESEYDWKVHQLEGKPFSDEDYDGLRALFINTFDAEGSIDLIGTKIMTGHELKEGDFEFEITDTTTGASAIVKNTPSKTVNINGAETIGAVEFKASELKDKGLLNYEYKPIQDPNDPEKLTYKDDRGTHVYRIRELKGSNPKPGVKYDEREYEVTVNVQLVKEDGKYKLDPSVTKVTYSYPDKPSIPPASIIINRSSYFEFKNDFSAVGEFEILGQKKVIYENTDDLVSPDALKNQYNFALYSYTDAARTKGKTLVDTATTDKDGYFTLRVSGLNQDIMIDENGVILDEKPLYYRIIEVKPSVGKWADAARTIWESEGVIYDNTEYDVDVTASFEIKNGVATGKLLTPKKIKNLNTGEDVSNVKYVTFTNTSKKYEVIEGNKYWIDNFTDPKDRPNVVVNLYAKTASGVERKINSYTIVAPDTTYRFVTDSEGNKLPTYDSEGRPITYTVEETPIENYLSEKVNYDFYNTWGDILIRKIDADTRAPLAGAVLAVYDGSKEIERWTSGRSAHVMQPDLLTPGRTYTLREITAPEGYEAVDDMTFTVPTDGNRITVTMSDPPIVGSVRLTKRDASTRETLAGAEFALYNEAGTRIYATGTAGSYRATETTSNGVFVTDASGMLEISNLPYGTYYFRETKAPDGYSLTTERAGFTIIRSGELVEVTVLDPKAEGSVRLRKLDTSGRTLAGAVFELYAATPRTVGMAATATIFSDAYYRIGTYRTNAAGEIYVTGLPWDDYYFIEVDAPSGYVVSRDVNGDDLVYTFRISAATADRTIDLGGIINSPEEPPTGPTITPTPGVLGERVPRATSTPTPKGGVLGERVAKGGVVQGVLGVRAKPNSGVLGERVGPVTGDASNIVLWLLLLGACVATIVATIVTGKKKKTGAK